MVGDILQFSLKNKSYLISLLAFHSRFIALASKGRATDFIYLDLGKAFDTVLHNILALKLKICELDRWTTLVSNFLDSCTQRVAVNSSMSKWRPVTNGSSRVSIGTGAV